MNDSRIWIHPVIMTVTAPPHTKVMGNFVYEAVPDGLELAHCLFTGDSLIPSDFRDGNIVAIGTGALSNADNLQQVSLPGSIRRIGDYAFFQCNQLTKVRLQPGTRSIGDCAFAGCTNLQSVCVPSTVETIGKDAFRGAEKLVLQGHEDSPIHRYAMENNLAFTAICDPNVA